MFGENAIYWPDDIEEQEEKDIYTIDGIDEDDSLMPGEQGFMKGYISF